LRTKAEFHVKFTDASAALLRLKVRPFD